MRKKIVAGNWKMNNDLVATNTLISELIKKEKTTNAEVMIAPAFVNLLEASKLLKYSSIIVAAQNMHFAENGAYTGEISAAMLKSIGVNTVILGHSERREYFSEDDNLLKQKIDKALDEHMKIIFCFGEKWEDRSVDNHFIVVENQIKNALFHLENENWESIVLAYEPVWAIGTGQTASPEQAQEMHAFIRNLVKKHYNSTISEEVSILYGGSVKPENAKEIFGKNDVDGGLIGGAALNADNFMAIVNAF
ncbi:MAG: triose-phosphate isomerase [Flavobacteriaceae bacterium]|jgi:triosephosphate isomerase|nr:triose-phosphate isomerase [Flavobacteriaceae bacterium]MBT3919832.1 triose-phosphate isomerase [Flavobacteriaceae bacterium]MBT6705898.1 triose-phosphate isomerase [Flavobacteriaceae bacterium]MBT7243641.1 triose-phosphate isomerase [Flavobacteriaceae bacterium]MDG2052712.1 triose-phosphate isomerase [Flavobacteriaceae bacterium]|tara:strand:+ start:1865 stop:2614 length:750 start_codon:yes stop_codon:yes gene_type:complete